MPRRNLYALGLLTVFCLMCAMRASRYARTIVYAMEEITARALEPADKQKLFEGAMEGMTTRLDDYSDYISPEMLQQFEESLNKEFGGIGIEIHLDPRTKQLTVASPLVGTPAYEAGIRAGDRILRIDGVSTQGLSLREAALRLRGKPGEAVALSILHSGEETPVELTIIRRVIRVETVLGDTRNPDGSWNFFLEGHPHVAYVRINSFGERTGEELQRVLAHLASQGMKGLVLDLRNDPGGLLGAAIDVCDLFVDSGVIVTTRRRDGTIRQTFSAKPNRPSYLDLPLAVLINRHSASASEIVAACLQDHERAVVVGERSFGKGTVQELVELGPGLGLLKLTTASYWRPSGQNIHRTKGAKEDEPWGVSPSPGYEVVVEGKDLTKLLEWRARRDVYRPSSTPADEEALPDSYVDPQLAKAIQYLENQITK